MGMPLSCTETLRNVTLLLVLIAWAGPAAQAWNVAVVDADGSPTVMVSSDRSLPGVDAYLIWVDADVRGPAAVQSWRLQEGWRNGIAAANSAPLDIPVLPAFALTALTPACPADHRCFLFLGAVAAGADPLIADNRLALATQPLTAAAAAERVEGQSQFLARGEAFRNFSPLALAGPAVAEDQGAEEAPEVEKPDIFTLEDHRLIFANAQAERLQVIDLIDPVSPALTGELRIEGSPQEIYALGDFYLVLQNSTVDSSQATRIRVVQVNAQGAPTQVAELTLPGYFTQSRRRDQRLYVVTAAFSGSPTLQIHAVDVAADGALSQVATETVNGYDPKVAIFPDYLVIADRAPVGLQSDEISVFALNDSAQALVRAAGITVPGHVPSEFHLDVSDGLLRVVYGPNGGQRSGSTLAIYDLTAVGTPPVGAVSGIAPGEALFATRFAGDLAYVVTYERIDPLWVIDLADPTRPTIVGELEVPGWSEKLFFHDQRLFAVGIDDQPSAAEPFSRARRVSVGLFDVSDPSAPAQLDRYTPLVGEAGWSTSLALTDERALLLDWVGGLAALPIESWETVAGSHLQVVSLLGDEILDAGLLDVGTPVKRSMMLGVDMLGVLGDQSFMTVSLSGAAPQVLGELELARDIAWLNLVDGHLWAAGRGAQGYHRFYDYDPEDLDRTRQDFRLPRGYDDLRMGDGLAVFYDRYALALQVIDTVSGRIWPAQDLEDTVTFAERSAATWVSRSQALVADSKFFIAEQNYLADVGVSTLLFPVPGPVPVPDTVWRLRTWDLAESGASEQAARSIPGQPVAISAAGELITYEITVEGRTQLHRLTLEPERARLQQTLELDCYAVEFAVSEDTLYTGCGGGFFPGPIPLAAENGNPTTDGTVLKIALGPSLAELGRWSVSGSRRVIAAYQDRVLLGPNYYYAFAPAVDVAFIGAPIVQSPCEVFALEQTGARSLATIENCPSPDGSALDAQRLFLARGFAGIDVVDW